MPPADAQIAAALKQISADHIQANIEKLVSFGTRSTLSTQDHNRLQLAAESALLAGGSRASLRATPRIAAAASR